MNNLTPTPIVDKNGKRTTVHKRTDSARGNSNRSIPKPKRPKNPIDIVESSLKRSKVKMSASSTFAVLRVLSNPTEDRFDRVVDVVKREYGVNDSRATKITEFLFRDAGLKMEKKVIPYSDILQKASLDMISRSHKKRYVSEKEQTVQREEKQNDAPTTQEPSILDMVNQMLQQQD